MTDPSVAAERISVVPALRLWLATLATQEEFAQSIAGGADESPTAGAAATRS